MRRNGSVCILVFILTESHLQLLSRHHLRLCPCFSCHICPHPYSGSYFLRYLHRYYLPKYRHRCRLCFAYLRKFEILCAYGIFGYKRIVRVNSISVVFICIHLRAYGRDDWFP